MKEVDENNGADSVLEEDDQVMEMINVVKDDGLMMVDMEYDGGESLEDTDTSVKMEEIDCLKMVHTPLLEAITERDAHTRS